jgi:hypothetical protein
MNRLQELLYIRAMKETDRDRSKKIFSRFGGRRPKDPATRFFIWSQRNGVSEMEWLHSGMELLRLGVELLRLSPSVENPSGGASVAYFFYSSLLGYFENILVQPFDEGRDSLQRLCLEIFSNRLVLDQKHFE